MKKCPAFIDVNGELIEVPKSLKIKPIGMLIGIDAEFAAYEKIEDIFDRELKKVVTSCAYVLCEAMTGKPHDNDEADKLMPIIEKMPVTEVMPMALFFWRNIKRSKRNGMNGFRVRRAMKRIGGSAKRSLGLGTSGLSTVSQGATQSNMKKQ
jgi:hypothetical protein